MWFLWNWCFVFEQLLIQPLLKYRAASVFMSSISKDILTKWLVTIKQKSIQMYLRWQAREVSPLCSEVAKWNGSSHRSPLTPLPGHAVGIEVFSEKLFCVKFFVFCYAKFVNMYEIKFSCFLISINQNCLPRQSLLFFFKVWYPHRTSRMCNKRKNNERKKKIPIYAQLFSTNCKWQPHVSAI